MEKRETNFNLNSILTKERDAASFDIDEFSDWLFVSPGLRQLKKWITDELYKDLDDPMILEYLSYEQANTLAVKQAVEAVTKLKRLQRISGQNIDPAFLAGLIGSVLTPAGNPLAVHVLMFTRAIKSQGTAALYEKYGKRAQNFEIIGTYAQTELGHGTNLRALETRADYDQAVDELILNTPTITSYKWWPGGLGHLANYAIVAAQLYVDNELKGLQLFLVPLRDEVTHVPLTGIDIGEIGKKIGMLGTNNGYLGLKDVRIPRENMLMRNARLQKDGSFVQSTKRQLNYFPMVFVRVAVALGATTYLAQAVTIATRYSAVRFQGSNRADSKEVQILDHRMQQLKVLPEIATAIAYRSSIWQLWQLYATATKQIGSGDYTRLAELHALSCTLKFATTQDSTFGIERLRQACGGHGYLTAANLGNLYMQASAACTYEGENTVLQLQVGKILMKTWRDLLAGKPLMPTFDYMRECGQQREPLSWSSSCECMVKALQYIATKRTEIAYTNFTWRLARGQREPEALNGSSIELLRAAQLHGTAFVCATFLLDVTTPSAGSPRSPALDELLNRILELYLIISVQRNMGDISRFVTLTESDIEALQSRLESVLQALRPDAIAIVDGFQFHDRELNSALGAYDGRVYERILDTARKSPMNQKTVPDSFEMYLRPFMNSKL